MKNELYEVLIQVKKVYKYLKNYSYLHKKINLDTYHPIPIKDVIGYNMNRYNGSEKYICFAPFTNLFFDIRGKVVVCNQNRIYLVGDIHKQSIYEIWKGDELFKIRNYLQNHDFTLGCNKCADAIKSKNYHGLPALSYDSTPYTNKDYPVRMEFEMGNTCNLACKMCNSYFSSTYKKYFQDDADDPIPYPEDFVEQLTPFIPHLKYTKFTGGEPFLIPIYFKIWEKIIEINPDCGIHIQTNGLVLNNKIKKILEKGNFHIGVSLDGASKESYESIRVFGNFERLNENLIYFKDYCKSKKTILNIPFTPTRETLYEVQKFPVFANKYDAYAFFNVIWEPHSLAIWTLSSVELQKALEFHQNQKIENSTYLESHNKRQYEFFIKQLEQWVINAKARELDALNYNKYTNYQLIDLLIERLLKFQDYSCKIWINDKEISEPIKFYKEKFNTKLAKSPTEIRSKLIELCTYDTERVFMELSSFSHLW